MSPFIRALGLTVSLAALAGCATAHPVAQAVVKPVPPTFVQATRQADPAPTVTVHPLPETPVPPVLVVTMPVPPDKPIAAGKPLDRIAAANKAAVQEPRADGYVNAIQIFPYMEGALYKLYTAPDRVTDISLQAGEQLIAISAGDTARWIIGNTHSGAGTDQRVHILVKPQLAGLKTNLIIATDRRTYHLAMESTAATAMAALSWRYPQDELLALQAAAKSAEATTPTADGIDLDKVQFGYSITGSAATWRPVRAFDDGTHVYIEFPKTPGTSEAPPLFAVGKGGQAQLINYRVRRNYYITDGLFDVAELRLGQTPQVIVRITADRKGGGRHD